MKKLIIGSGGKYPGQIQETSTGKTLLGKGGNVLGYYNEAEDTNYRPGAVFYSNSNCLVELLED